MRSDGGSEGAAKAVEGGAELRAGGFYVRVGAFGAGGDHALLVDGGERDGKLFETAARKGRDGLSGRTAGEKTGAGG